MEKYSGLFPAEIGRRIRDLRISRSMTQKEFAGLIGISPSYLGAIERGVRPVSRNVLQSLHDCFALSCDYLLDGSAFDASSVRAVNQVSEGSSYRTRRNFFYLLSSCDPKEADECCRLLAAYLNRKKQGEVRTVPEP